MAAPANYKGTKDVALIGGGDLMVHAARLFMKRDVRVVVILAPRHAGETLPVSGTNTASAFKEDGAPVFIIDDINDWPALEVQDWTGDDSLALCFGPAWIFSPQVIAAFGRGMINFNGIPIPRYLGGAHYTWQIMHGDRTGGCILQAITDDLDRGPILRSTYFDLPEDVRTPQDYFEANHQKGSAFLESAIGDIVDGVAFESRDFTALDNERLYFPRLFTPKSAFIDWSWTIGEIARFCDAFDAPYIGAASFLNKKMVRFADVTIWEERADMHIFGAGLIVRRHLDAAWIAARGGILKAGRARFDDGTDAMGEIKEGSRLLTPLPVLEEALAFSPIITGDGVANG